MRMSRNPRYSLRSFARAVGVSHSLLSLVLSGKRPPSLEFTDKICKGIGLPPNIEARLKKQFRQNQKVGKVVEMDSTKYSTQTLEDFELISDWYHFAILSLLELDDAKFTSVWIASRLGITRTQASLAMKALVRRGLVEQEVTGRWKQSGRPIIFDNRISTAATKRHQTQLLDRARESLHNDSVEHRDFSAVTFAMSKSQIEYAKMEIKRFRRELMEKLESYKVPDEVYTLSIQLYPQSKIERKK